MEEALVMGRSASNKQSDVEVGRRPGTVLGEPGSSGFPIPTLSATRDFVATLLKLVDTLNELPSTIPARTPTHSPKLPLLLDASEAAKLLSLSRSKVSNMAGRGELPSIRIGRVVRIPSDALRAWIEERATGTSNKVQVWLPNWTHIDRSNEL
jgi:excisionase family DNA binding protein